MRFFYRIIISFILLLSLSDWSNAQQYSFENFTIESGLSQSQILSVFQNDDGVMWFGTNNGGITKYDGNSFEYISDKDGLPDKIIFSISKDKSNHILIGTNNGLSVYDGKKYTNYTIKNGLTHDRIFKIFIDSKNRVWLGTGQGVTMMNNNTFTKFNSNGLLDSMAVFNIMEDSNHTIWFSTLGNGVVKYDGTTFTTINTGNSGVKSDIVYSVCEVSKNNFWFFTDLSLESYVNGKSTEIEPDVFQVLKSKKTEIGFYCFNKDDKGNLWIGTDQGLLKYTSGKFYLYNEQTGLVHNVIWQILQDRERNMWFASKENGISKLQSETFITDSKKTGLISDNVSAIHQSKNGILYIGTKTGITIQDGFKNASYGTKDFGGNLNDDIQTIAEDSKGIIYIGTTYGIVKYNGKSFDIITNEKKGSENLNFCLDILIDENDEIWLGTRGGLAKLKNNEITEVSGDYLPKKSIFKIHQYKTGVFLIASESGLFKYDGNSVEFFTEGEGFIRKQVFSICEDKKGNLWIGTPSSGIYKYSGGKFTNYNEKNGLSSNNIQSIIVDEKENVWVGQTNGIEKIQFNKDGSLNIKHYGVEEGFVGQECILNAIMIDNKKQLLVGTSKGLMICRDQYNKENTFEPITRLKEIKLFSQPTDWSNYSTTVGDNNIPVNLELEYNKNYLTFNFIGVSLTTPTKVQYQYILKGFDKDWIAITQKTEAIYSNIPPGTYEFLVKANNGAGIWNTQPVSFKFTILPPFWRTWWFYSIVTLIIISFIYSYVKIQAANKKILVQNEIIEDKNKNITDSINYAKRIQDAILPPPAQLNNYLKDSFIFFKPKDIVSGDFYFFNKLDNKLLITAVDCTGHGVPGALMSIVGHTALKHAANKFGNLGSGEVLDKLNRNVEKILMQNNKTAVKDGMDISMLIVDILNKNVNFSGANNPVYIVRKKEEGELILNNVTHTPNISNDKYNLYEIKGDKQPIGAFENRKNYTTHNFTLSNSDTLYIFTDGYADQFGGVNNKKFMYKSFKELLLRIQDKNMQQQEEILENTINDWRGGMEQIDDVLVIGVRL